MVCMLPLLAHASNHKEKADHPQHDSKLDCRRVPPPCLKTQPGGKALVFWLARTTGQKTTQVLRWTFIYRF